MATLRRLKRCCRFLDTIAEFWGMLRKTRRQLCKAVDISDRNRNRIVAITENRLPTASVPTSSEPLKQDDVHRHTNGTRTQDVYCWCRNTSFVSEQLHDIRTTQLWRSGQSLKNVARGSEASVSNTLQRQHSLTRTWLSRTVHWYLRSVSL